MSVEQYNPKQTTTLEIPAKILSAQAKEQAKSAIESNNSSGEESVRAAKVGFVSLG